MGIICFNFINSIHTSQKMDKIIDLLEDLGIHIALIIAGIFGSLLSLEDREGLTSWQKIAVFLSGGAIANYMTPALIDWADVNQNVMFGLAFILGFSGLKGMKYLILKIKCRYNKD